MSETSAVRRPDPEHEWADLLRGLTLPQRRAVLGTLERSAASGWPATRAGVESLVAYATGRISAKEYAAQSLVALGYADIQTANALLDSASEAKPEPRVESTEPTGRLDASAGYDFLYER